MALTDEEKKAIQDEKEQEHRAEIIQKAKDDFKEGKEDAPGKGLFERAVVGSFTFGLGAFQDEEVTKDRELYQETQDELRKK